MKNETGMSKDEERRIRAIYSRYKANVRLCADKSYVDTLSAVDFSRICVQSDKSKNPTEERIAAHLDTIYRAKREKDLVDAVIAYYKIEGEGREKFVKAYFVDERSWIAVTYDCSICSATVYKWRRDVLARTAAIAKMMGFDL